MKLNNKGFTLIELLATMLVLGILMAMVIPNIIGISTQNKIATYAEDAKRFKNSVEYMLRSDSTLIRPKENGECVIVNLKYVNGSDADFDNPPYGGKYDMNSSYVVMSKEDKRYKYYVQLIEDLPGNDGMRGIKLIEATRLDGDGYLDDDVLWENSGLPEEMKIKTLADGNLHVWTKNYVADNTGCTTARRLYFQY